jgi:hypothetical protein
MPASIDRGRQARLGLLVTTLLLASGPALAQFGAPLIENVDSSDAGRHVNVFAQLRCTARYLGHSPADGGGEVRVRLRLGPDCGATDRVGNEQAPGVGASAVVRSIRVESTLPGEIELVIAWNGDHHFAVTPTSDARGVRVRILDVFPAPRSAVQVAPLDEATSGYAVNLASRTEDFAADEIAAASARLHTPVHVSSVELAGQTWYRLRAGPIGTRADAQRLLAVARTAYPRAWLGVADEPAAAEIVLPPASQLAPPTVTDPALRDEERAVLMKDARRRLAARDYPRATELLTRLTRQPEYPGRARAQELLGLSRERAGQVAHAKAEYEEYLRRYPKGDAVARVRSRLRALASAARSGRGGALGSAGAADAAWRMSGGTSVQYRWQRSSLTTANVAVENQDQNALYTDVDWTARRRGERFDFVSRISAGYAHDLLTDGPGDQVRVSSAFAEINDRERGVATRVGRQSRNSGGLLGTFDGAYASWQWREAVAFNVAAGFPVESTRAAPESGRRFFGLSTEFGPYDDKLDFGAFAVIQQLDGLADRQAVGLEGRYFVPGRTLLAMVDYDLHYQEINSAVLTGSLQLPARWALSFSGDHRRAPVLTTRNALIGQPFATLDDMLTLYSSAEVERLARDRTPLSDLVSLSISRPLGERFQFSLEAYGSRIDATVASGNVAATPSTGWERTAQLQLTANNLVEANDLWLLALRRQDGALAQIDSILLAARLPLGGAWRLGPRLRVDRRTSLLDEADETVYVPTLRLDYLRGRSWFECEIGAEQGARQLAAGQEDTERLYFGLAWRMNY